MNEEIDDREAEGKRGIPANAIMMPLGAMFSILLVCVVFLILEVNRSSNELSDLMERNGVYQLEATELQMGINTLSETANSFVQTPVTGDGTTNVGPLKAYAEEMGKDRLASKIAERFEGYEVSDEVLSHIEGAAETSREMMDVQAHAIALVSSVHPLPPIPELSTIPEAILSAEEQAMPAEARIGLARRLMQDQDYAQMRYRIGEDVGSCNHLLQQEFSTASAKAKRYVTTIRTVLWVTFFAIVGLLALSFAILRSWVVWPLRRHAAEITSDLPMTQLSGIREMRVLVDAYNGLLARRNKLESMLSYAAKTDALTGLLNRYSLEQYVAAHDDSSMALLVFDVNFLKEVNDTQGHVAGDQLLRTVADCIRTCFATEDNDNCFRFGGDEFCAVLRGCAEAEVHERIDRFYDMLRSRRISVSVGYAYADSIDRESFKTLLDEADVRMYENKKRAHAMRSAS